eukprot:CAMPEP_0119379980 /NCGR_PEP_ID=MMETSP1334-20130426/54975_1 /TAXON_ID=127549 /ORGANISM="Calcidiscus leptoporus, Strain RCC1130" /LENGTH=1061 /DNA_ID=CAMNT_0007399645 /DNA_START=58 /DNA_END=3243 /DNA_ORIENTATION=+
MALKAWVSDQLHSLIGFSESHLADYVASLATTERSLSGLLTKLHAADVPASKSTEAFATELFSRTAASRAQGGGGGSKGREASRRVETEAALRKKSEKYAMVDSNDDDEENDAEAAVQRSLAEKRAAEREAKKRAKKRAKEESAGASATVEADGGEDAVEAQRQRDIEERDALVERMRARDAERTRKLAHNDPDALALEGRRVAESELVGARDGDEQAELVSKLRTAARRKYLKEREQKKLAEAGDDIVDEEFLFGDVSLTAKEREEVELKKKLYGYAKERVSITDKVERYHMPESYDAADAVDQAKRFEPMMARYQEEEAEELNEFQAWDATQIKRSTAKVGAADAKGSGQIGSGASAYELVMAQEEQIDFIQDELVAGNIDESGKATAAAKVSKKASMKQVRESLPVYPYREQIIEAVREYQCLVIVGETGSGKTTQIPQYLHEAGFTDGGMKIGCTQPRRVAAMSVAKRVADEMRCKLGNEVGYSIRFEDCTSERTVLKYMTDGMLLREFLGEPDLASYSVMILDEAHERTLHTDILFGLLKDIARFRPDIKLLVSSATLDAAKFSEYFDDAPVFNIPGRRYPVDILYTKAPEADYVEAAVVTVLQIHITQAAGDVLVFFTGQEEIESAQETLQHRTRGFGTKIGELIVLPIYANLPSDMQAKIFEPTPPGARKVVLATNIAETSITIDNIVYVIDPGFNKMNSYNPRSGMESLIVTPVAKSSANQRAGRAGRVAPGKCFRLFTKWAYLNELEDNIIPEIQRTNLGSVVLMLKSLGINDLIHFDFMDPPPAETLIRALEQLYALGALNDRGELTKLGRRMAEFPMDPQLSKMLIASEAYGVTAQVLAICGMLQIGASIFYRPKERALHADNARVLFNKPGGDHMTLLNVWTQWAETNYSTQWCFENFIQVRSMRKARDIREQIENLMERVELELSSNPSGDDGICKSITSGFFYHTAKLQKTLDYRTVKHPQTVHIHPSSSLHGSQPRWVVYHELVFTSKEFMRQVIEIKPEWLVDIAPHYYKTKDIEDASGKKMPKTVGKAAPSSSAAAPSSSAVAT